MLDNPKLNVKAAMAADGETAAVISVISQGERFLDLASRESIVEKVVEWLNTASSKTQSAIDKIAAWLGEQSSHFGVSAFDALKLIVNPIAAVADYAALAAKAIIKDIAIGAISDSPTGALEISLAALKSSAAEAAGREAFAYRVSFNELKNLAASNNRVIAHVGTGHYVVITSIDSSGNVHIIENEQESVISRDDFTGTWGGAVVSFIKPKTGTALSLEEAAQIKGAGANFFDPLSVNMGQGVPGMSGANWYGPRNPYTVSLSDIDLTEYIYSWSVDPNDPLGVTGGIEEQSVRYYEKDEVSGEQKLLYERDNPQNQNRRDKSWIKEFSFIPGGCRVAYLTKDVFGNFGKTGIVVDFTRNASSWLSFDVSRLWTPHFDGLTNAYDPSTGATLNSTVNMLRSIVLNNIVVDGKQVPAKQVINQNEIGRAHV